MLQTFSENTAIWAFAEGEHRELARGLDHIHAAACDGTIVPVPELSDRVLAVLTWLRSVFQPHVDWEESWLYPQIDARLDTPWATRAARCEHRQIHEMTMQLERDYNLLHGPRTPTLAMETRGHLFAIEALIRAHIEREERFLVPILGS